MPRHDEGPSIRQQIGTMLIGLSAGGIAVAFHAVMNLAEETRADLAILAAGHGWPARLAVVLACGGFAAAAVALVRMVAPEAEGSGIAAVLAVRTSVEPPRAVRVLWVKFVAGFLGLASGMPLGREGPSVQIGAMTAVLLRRYGPRLAVYRSRAVHLGAAAGLAAAFNAPLSGILFSFELLRQPFTARNCFETVMACAMADWLCRMCHGPILEIPIALEGFRSWRAIPVFALVGLWTGLVTLVFQKLLLVCARGFQRVAHDTRAACTVTGLWGCVLGGVLFVWPETLGIGHELFADAIDGRMTLAVALAALAIRVMLSAGSYATGAPGGLIVPALLFGVLAGQAFSQSLAMVLPGTHPDIHALCLVAGMAASIGGLFRTPLTAMVMAIEITGASQGLLEIAVAYVASHALLAAAGVSDLYTAMARLHAAHVKAGHR